MGNKRITSFILILVLIISIVPFASVKAAITADKRETTDKVKNIRNKVILAEKITTAIKKEFSKDEVLVKYKSTIRTQEVGKVEKGKSIEKVKDFGATGIKLYKIKNGESVNQTISELKQDENVVYAEPNYKIKIDTVNDPFYRRLWGLKNTGQLVKGFLGTAGMDINVEDIWKRTLGTNVVVGVIDEGIDINHPDLKNNIWKNPKEIPGDKIDNDHNGYVDDINGWDFYNGDNTVYDSKDSDEHGTHVAGTIGASANNLGVIGVAPNVKLVSLKFAGPNGGYTSDAIEAIQYAEKMGIKILNNSWGANVYSKALHDAIKNYNGLFVAAAGNDGLNNDHTPMYPSSYDLPNIISVASIDNKGERSYFSNYGVKSVDVAAPGEDIFSTAPYGYANNYKFAYQYMSGTSMATPYVTGSAALVLAAHPKYTAKNIKQALMGSVRKLPSLKGVVASGGLINTGKSVTFGTDDDLPGSPLKGSKVSGSLDISADPDDVYAVTLTKGERVAAKLTGAAGTDFDLYLFKENSTVQNSDGLLTSSKKRGTSSESVTFIAPYSGTFYLDASAYSGKGTYSLTVTLGATAGSYDNKNGVLNYISSAPWNIISNTYASNGSYSSINAPNSSVEFIFNGTGIQYRALKNSQQGIVRITLDGISQNMDLFSKMTQYNAPVYEKVDLQPGIHKLKIEWTGLKNSMASKASTKINIDSITVTNKRTVTIEENNPTLTYSGSWAVGKSASLSGGSAKYSSVKGSAALLNFTGEGVKVTGYTGRDRGKADIYVDGKLVKTVDLYSSTSKYKVTLYETANLTKGSHAVKIVNRGEKSAASTGTAISLDSFIISQKFGSYRTEENASTLSYKGTWSVNTSGNHSGGTAQFSTTAGNSVEYTFTGRGLRLLSNTGANRGMADIYVDGRLVKTVNMYTSSTLYQVPVYSVTNLPLGSHKVKVVNKGTKSTASQGTMITVDAFEATAY